MNPFDSPHFRGTPKVYVQGREVKPGSIKRDVILVDAIAAMREFCTKVEAGTILSRNTYNQFKKILARYDAL